MSKRSRRPHTELKNAMRAFLATLDGGHDSIAEIKEAIRPVVGTAPDSSYRSALQDEDPGTLAQDETVTVRGERA